MITLNAGMFVGLVLVVIGLYELIARALQYLARKPVVFPNLDVSPEIVSLFEAFWQSSDHNKRIVMGFGTANLEVKVDGFRTKTLLLNELTRTDYMYACGQYYKFKNILLPERKKLDSSYAMSLLFDTKEKENANK